MSWILKLLVSLSLSTSLLTGTMPAEKQMPGSSRMIVSVEISDGVSWMRCAQPEQVETVLYYIRGLDDLLPAREDPERYVGDSRTIILHDAGGGRQVYRQKGERWLSRNSRPWRRISREKGRMFPVLMAVLRIQATEG